MVASLVAWDLEVMMQVWWAVQALLGVVSSAVVSLMLAMQVAMPVVTLLQSQLVHHAHLFLVQFRPRRSSRTVRCQ